LGQFTGRVEGSVIGVFLVEEMFGIFMGNYELRWKRLDCGWERDRELLIWAGKVVMVSRK
jgi:hypothetical protein